LADPPGSAASWLLYTVMIRRCQSTILPTPRPNPPGSGTVLERATTSSTDDDGVRLLIVTVIYDRWPQTSTGGSLRTRFAARGCRM